MLTLLGRSLLGSEVDASAIGLLDGHPLVTRIHGCKGDRSASSCVELDLVLVVDLGRHGDEGWYSTHRDSADSHCCWEASRCMISASVGTAPA